MPTKQQLRDLARLRLREAKTLFDAGCYDGAVYLCGYTLEMALKARICRLLQSNNYPARKDYGRAYAIHDLDKLLFLAGLRSYLSSGSPKLKRNWSIGAAWQPTKRYDPVGTYSKQDAKSILDAVGEPKDGLLRWISKRW